MVTHFNMRVAAGTVLHSMCPPIRDRARQEGADVRDVEVEEQ